MTRRRKLLWLVVAAAAAMAAYSAAGERGFGRYLTLRREVAALAERNAHLERANRSMLAEVEALRKDDRALERAAREELGFVKPGEVVINLE